MRAISTPNKPFNDYKWRWLSVQPSEGLLKLPVYLGVLRALKRNEGRKFSSQELFEDLKSVQQETSSTVKLARKAERNLFRNSGQYWKGTGLVRQTSNGYIELSPFGTNVANGDITADEFADIVVRNTILPNPLTHNEDSVRMWEGANLSIKPFIIILQVMSSLRTQFGDDHGWLSPLELIKILIPMAGSKAELKDIAQAIVQFRNDEIDISSWPNCATEANDHRLAKEFLLFLQNFGICRVDGSPPKQENYRYFIDAGTSFDVFSDTGTSLYTQTSNLAAELEATKESSITKSIERNRIATTRIHRPNQKQFRDSVFEASNTQCVLTGEAMKDVLEAAHIIPVSHNGSDSESNGFCMRVDLHRLYDKGKIRIFSNGVVKYNTDVANSISYSSLPPAIQLPQSTSLENLAWRNKYL